MPKPILVGKQYIRGADRFPVMVESAEEAKRKAAERLTPPSGFEIVVFEDDAYYRIAWGEKWQD